MGALNKRRRAWLGATVMVLVCLSAAAQAQDLLVRNATVHTASARGSLQHADVLVQGGIIRAVGNGLSAPAGANVVEADGRPLTPALFGGITEIGIEEVSGEASTVDSTPCDTLENTECVCRTFINRFFLHQNCYNR